MALRSLTNSPVRPSQSHRKTHLSSTSEFPVSGNSSEVFPFASADDGIYDAQRVASDQDSSVLNERPLGTVYQSNHDRTGNIDVRLRRRQAHSESNTTSTERPPIQRFSTEVKADQHCRGWSLNGLDCVVHIHNAFQNAASYRSPSSNEALEAAANAGVYPHLPPGPPPCRVSTPDGLPSFGTREAQELRLVPPSRLRRFGTLIRRRLQPPELSENVADNAVDTHNIDQQRDAAFQRSRFKGPADVLKRVSGMVRPVPVNNSSRKVRRSALPRSVRVASIPGDLTMAEDGSHVRGRFGNRVSGHGVGQRTMDLHPLARGQEGSTIEEEVRAINKACDLVNPTDQYRPASNPGELRSLQRGEYNDLQNPTGDHVRIVDMSTVAQATQNETRALRALEGQRRQKPQLRASLRVSQVPPVAPSITFDPVHASQPSHSRNSSSTVYHTARARNNTSNIRSSASETVGLPHMIEPGSYDTGRPRSVAAQGSMLGRSTREATLEEQDQASQSARQREDHKSETEAC